MSNGDDNDQNKPRRSKTQKRLISRDGDMEIWHISFSVSEPDPLDSPYWPDLFRDVRGWLSYLCSDFQPEERVVAYYFGLNEFSPGKYSVVFIGSLKFDPADKEWPFCVDDDIQDSYTLPAAQYKDLSREEVLKKFVAELKAFSETEQFKQSFFEKAKAVATGFFKEEIILIK